MKEKLFIYLKMMFFILKVFFIVFMMYLHFSNVVLLIKENIKLGIIPDFVLLITWTTLLVIIIVQEVKEILK